MIRKQSISAMNHCRFYRVEFSTPWFVIKSATVLPFRVVISLLLDGHKHHLEYPWINCMVADPSNRFQDRSLLEDHHTQKLVTAITLALRDLRGGLPVVKSSFYTHLTVEYNNIYLSILFLFLFYSILILFYSNSILFYSIYLSIYLYIYLPNRFNSQPTETKTHAVRIGAYMGLW
jgi:hypothetical protein